MQAVQIIPGPVGGNLQIIPLPVANTVEKKPAPVAVINSGTKLSLLRDNPLFTDTVLEISGVQRFPAHKAILGISSEYFKTVLAGRFGQSSTIVLSQVEAQTVDLYLDMVYGKELVLYDWRQVLKLLVFAKFTQTNIAQQDDIIKKIMVKPQDFVEYIQELSAFYDNAIPLDVIEALNVPQGYYNNDKFESYIDEINFSDLGEEFVTALIETRTSDDNKYVIAQRAVKEGMSTNLYGLIQMEKVRPELLTPESIPFLRKFDRSRLYNTTVRHSGSMTLLIDGYLGDVIATGTKYMLLRTKTQNGRRIFLALLIRDYMDADGENVMVTVSSDGTERKIDEVLNAVAIESKTHHISEELNNAIGRLRIDADFGPIIVDTYELY